MKMNVSVMWFSGKHFGNFGKGVIIFVVRRRGGMMG